MANKSTGILSGILERTQEAVKGISKIGDAAVSGNALNGSSGRKRTTPTEITRHANEAPSSKTTATQQEQTSQQSEPQAVTEQPQASSQPSRRIPKVGASDIGANYESLTDREKAIANSTLAPSPNFGDPKVQSPQAHPSAELEVGTKSGKKKGKKNKGKSNKIEPLTSASVSEIRDRTQRALSNVNSIEAQPVPQFTPATNVQYGEVTEPFVDEELSNDRENSRRKRSGLGRGLTDMLSPESVRNRRATQLRRAVNQANDAFAQHRQQQRQSQDDAANMRMDAYGRIRDNTRNLLDARRDDILRAARELNNGQEILTREQMIALGITVDELEYLGIERLIPNRMRLDGIPEDSEVARGNEPYQTYRRLDDDNKDNKSAIERLSALRDQEVEGLTNVVIPDADQDIDESYDTFQGLANGIAPAEIESRDDRIKRVRESKLNTQMAWFNPLRIFSNLFEARTMEDRGFEYVMATMDKAAVNAVSNVSMAYHGLSIDSCLSLVMARGGIAYDNFGKMKPEIRNDVIIELCADILESIKINGLPNNMVKGKPYSRSVRDDYGNVVLGGTRCFPFGYIPNNVIREIRSIDGSPLSDMTEEQIRKMEYEQFMNVTLPAAVANMDEAQLAAYRTGMSALLEIDGQDSRYFDIPHDTAMTIMQRMEDLSKVDDPAVNMGAIVNNREAIEAADRAEAKYRHTPRSKYSVDGDSKRPGKLKSIISTERNPFNNANNALRALSNYTRTMGALNLGSMMMAIPESALSEVETMQANAMENALNDRLQRQGIDTSLYKPTDYIVSMVRSDEAVESMRVMDTLYHLDGMGWNVVAMFREGGYELSGEDLSKFIKDLHGMNDGRIADFDAFLSNVEHFWSRFMAGEGMFEKRDMQEWATTMLQMMAEHKARGIGAGVFTAAQMEEALQAGGARKFVTDMMLNSEVARDAYMFMGLNSFGSKNPISHAVEKYFKLNGLSQFMFGMFLDKFPTYGANAMMSKAPFSNTLSYIGSTLTTASGYAFKVDGWKDVKNYQAGLRTVFSKDGTMDVQGFYHGLRRNLIYDYVHLKNKLLMTCVIYTMIGRMGGLGVPDDEQNKYVLEEYRIGGANGTPIKYAWWLDDILGISVGAAVAQYLHDNGGYDRAGNHVDIDNETAASVMWYSAINQVDGTAIMDAIDMVGNLDENMTSLVMMMTDPEGYTDRIENSEMPIPKDLGEATTAFVEHYFVANTMRNMTPRFFNQLMPMNKGFILRDPNADEHTPWSVYDTRPTSWNPSGKSKEEAMATLDTTGVGYLEGRRRKDSQDNWLYGLWNDLVRLRWSPTDILNGGINRDETGYMYDEQAIGTKTDDSAMMYMDMFDFDPLHDEDGNAFTNQEDLRLHLNENAIQLIDTLENTWGEGNEYNVQKALADGLVIPYQARINAVEYCYYMYDQVYDAWQSIDQDIDSDQYWDFYYDNVRPAKEYWIDGIVKGWHLDYGDNTIPSVAPKYVKVRSDYVTRYLNEDGTPASFRDYISGDAVRDVYAYGNPQSELQPISMPRTDEDHAFNYELTPYWDVPGYTDYQAMADRLRGNTVDRGLNANQDLEQVYFGGQPDQSLSIPTDTGRATINLRNYRKSDLAELPEILRGDPTAESIRNLLGLANVHTPTSDEDTNGSSGDNGSSSSSGSSSGRSNGYGGNSYGGNSYGGGGGGYSYSGGSSYEYNPRIYSNPRSVYSTRASGMSTRAPYRATSTYLRPAFYTKGSREAYRRQD